MKKVLSITLTLLFCVNVFAQKLKNDIKGIEIRKEVSNVFPNIDLNNKILFISIWKSSDIQSRDNNKEFAHVSDIYEHARLKSGLNGVYFISLSIDDDKTSWYIATKKDLINNSYENSTHKYDELIGLLNNKTGCIVINFDGEVISNTLNKTNCFTFFNTCRLF